MKNRSGVFALVGAAALCSIGGVCIKGIPWTPLAVNGARCTVAACITGLFLRSSHHRLHWNLCVLRGALSLALTTILYVFSTKLAGAANADLLMYTSPVFVLLYLWAAKHQVPPKGAFSGCLIVFAGVALLVSGELGAGSLLGNLLGLCSGISYAGVFLVGSEPDGDAASSFFFGQVIGAALGLPFLWAERDFSAVPVLCALLLGVFQLGLSYILMAKGLEKTPPVTANLITAIEPILTPVWVALAFGETLSPAALLGAGLVIFGIVRYQLCAARTRPRA